MKILILNGSPRKNGNTSDAINLIIGGINTNMSSSEVELIDVTNKNITPCIACDACQKGDGNCIMKDDTVNLMNKVAEADFVIFATPVYWWGMTAQMKLVIDKFYSSEVRFQSKPKQIGVIAVGSFETTGIQYSLIETQFRCIAEFLKWEVALSIAASATAKGDLLKDIAKCEEFTNAHRLIGSPLN